MIEKIDKKCHKMGFIKYLTARGQTRSKLLLSQIGAFSIGIFEASNVYHEISHTRYLYRKRI